MSESSSKNIFIFTGEDDFSLREKVKFWKIEFAKKYSQTSIVTINGANLSEVELCKELESVLTPSLFSTKKLVIAQNALPTKASQIQLIEGLERLMKIIPPDYFLVFIQQTLDKRLGFIKNLVKLVNVVEFHLPHGRELDSWILMMAKKLGVEMDVNAANKLASTVGRDFFEEKKIAGKVIERKELFNLWQVYSELSKLASNTNKITTKEIEELVTPNLPENVFALSDELIRQNKKGALEVLERLMDDDNQDEKAVAIKLLGLISEQVRSQLVVSLLKQQQMNQDEIAKTLGWSSGRVFIMLKHSNGVDYEKIKSLLANLLKVDALVKSQDINPKLLIDMLIVK
jgi:DNA polymerase III delta subunit